MNVRASLAAFVALVALLTAPAAHGQHGGRPPAPAPRPNVQGSSSGVYLPRGNALLQAPLPDSVLARVFFSPGQTSLTATDYRNAALKLQADPDSLGPEARRQVLGMLIQQAVLNHRVAQARPRWLHRDSTNFESYADGLVLRAAVDSALADFGARIAARGDTVPERGALMAMIRDSALAGMAVVYDDEAIDSLTAAFGVLPEDDMRLPSSRRREILSEMPRVGAQIRSRVLGRCEAGGYTAGELLRDYEATGLLNRPRIRTASGLRNLVDDRLYTMLLRREGLRQHLASRPDIAPLLAVRRQFLTVQRFVQNEVYDRVPTDTATVRRYFEPEARRYDLGASAQIVRMLFDGRAQADSAVRQLTWPGYAESLSTRSLREGVPYLTTLGEDADTLLFARVDRGGVGAVIGPDATQDGWRVFKVMSITPRQPQTLAEAFVRARADWIELDGDRRMREMMAKLSAACRVTVNDSSSYLTGRRRTAQ